MAGSFCCCFVLAWFDGTNHWFDQQSHYFIDHRTQEEVSTRPEPEDVRELALELPTLNSNDAQSVGDPTGDRKSLLNHSDQHYV